MDTYYRERSGGTWSYWTYSDGLRVTLSERQAQYNLARGIAKLITVG